MNYKFEEVYSRKDKICKVIAIDENDKMQDVCNFILKNPCYSFTNTNNKNEECYYFYEVWTIENFDNIEIPGNKFTSTEFKKAISFAAPIIYSTSIFKFYVSDVNSKAKRVENNIILFKDAKKFLVDLNEVCKLKEITLDNPDKFSNKFILTEYEFKEKLVYDKTQKANNVNYKEVYNEIIGVRFDVHKIDYIGIKWDSFINYIKSSNNIGLDKYDKYNNQKNRDKIFKGLKSLGCLITNQNTYTYYHYFQKKSKYNDGTIGDTFYVMNLSKIKKIIEEEIKKSNPDIEDKNSVIENINPDIEDKNSVIEDNNNNNNNYNYDENNNYNYDEDYNYNYDEDNQDIEEDYSNQIDEKEKEKEEEYYNKLLALMSNPEYEMPNNDRDLEILNKRLKGEELDDNDKDYIDKVNEFKEKKKYLDDEYK